MQLRIYNILVIMVKQCWRFNDVFYMQIIIIIINSNKIKV